jgi:prepilin-type N-terminal cleavage/methylation domain-containing protein
MAHIPLQEKLTPRHDQGFALFEVIVAMVIMALIGIMAWQGMDAMIRGREGIDRRSNQDASYNQLVRQFERDCQTILRRDELIALSASPSVPAGTSAAAPTALTAPTAPMALVASTAPPSIAAGAKNIWWMRRYRADNQDAWMAVGYGMTPAGLQRWTSGPLLNRSEALALWTGLSREPDLTSSDLMPSVLVPAIVRQTFQVRAAVLNITGIPVNPNPPPASNTLGNTTSTVNNSGNTGGGIGTNNATGNVPPAPPVAGVYPDQQGVTMQWFMQDIPWPITRSCLMGGAL